jgi:predicted permease
MRFAFRPARTLRRYWKITAISVFSLSIAIALGVIALSISNTLLLLPPAAPEAGRLVMIYSRSQGEAIGQISYPDYQYFREHNHVFTDVAAAPDSVGIITNYDDSGHEVKLSTRAVSENYFAVLGLRPYLGSFFARGDDTDTASKAVMTWSCWKRLGSDLHIAGKQIYGRTILGVTPPEFTGAFYGINGDVLTNLGAESGGWRQERDTRRLLLTARLKPGATREQAQAELTALSGQLASAYPKDDKGRTAIVTRATLLSPGMIPDTLWITAVLILLVVLVLLIACANVANLLLAAAVGRRQEAAIKLAIGAPRGRLIREFLGESILLCSISGALGYALAIGVAAQFREFRLVFPQVGAVAFAINLRFDGAVLALTIALVVLSSLATGLAPAFYASSPALAQMLGGELAVGGTRKSAWRNTLVVVQVAVCTLVLIGMGLGQRNLYNLRHADLGFSVRNLMGLGVWMRAENYDTEARGREFYNTLRRTTAAIPGVESVSIASELPLLGSQQVQVTMPDRVKTISAGHVVVDDSYFSTIGLAIVAGRGFDASDRKSGTPAVVINRKLADLLWPGQNAIGRTILLEKPIKAFTVVGVAATSKYEDIDEEPSPFLYYALSQNYQANVSVMARTAGDPKTWLPEFRKAMRGLGLKIMVDPIGFDQWIEFNLFTQRAAALAADILSALALALAIVGLAGAISYSVGERKKELGIRVALGARPWQLLRMVLRQTALVAGAGIAVGILLGVVATTLLESQLYRIGAVEWTVLIPVGGAMLALSLLVAYLSARRWLMVDPMDAVRHA